ncbi:MAG: Ser/Thr protein phosphatase [Parcubacteria group bacterium GW2011_GWA2_43_17]|nr:MAG: Ser/Thr protein phosphatase [Parcubacteria group bacterium GW2011_GWA2_43_17]KKT94359.1 MAG: Ser/Thr protein phosphatase [Parcubacteria group bacterium GW2011_GWF2_45_11]KKT98721.1 MAG: Ser/Thr protein phosphatase [Parcubacteria group bacterium GW2011_GWC2_45_15]OGY93618.1 MAG: metallophosphoesterase [Candidatus Komeilibacteria bacterium RIFOXYA2_FULL_45_9]OGY94572.1 MAG: metallophosphoesterase [Candidatus Komeilibacteria bacterium RIFOXYC2_FULL_45_12]HAH04078.1 TIGR00282 family metall
MKILFFGDIVAKIGRQAMVKILPELKNKYQPDVILANVENIAHGKGVTAKTLTEMKNIGIDCFTSGNHVWKKEDVAEAVELSQSLLITPANDPRTLSDQGYAVIKVNGQNLLVINLLGRVFMNETDLRCPFRVADDILAKHNLNDLQAIIVDMHAEATSEKMALGWYLDGRVSAVIGTHTHIPTADDKILPAGAAYITDVGMVGPAESVLGVQKEIIIEKFLNDSPIVFKIPETGEVDVNALFIETAPPERRAVKIEKIYQKVYI